MHVEFNELELRHAGLRIAQPGRRLSALEDGWLLAGLLEGHGRSQADLAASFRRPKSEVSGRLAIVRALPESVQQAVRCGTVPTHGAVKCLVPLARANAGHGERLVDELGEEGAALG